MAEVGVAIEFKDGGISEAEVGGGVRAAERKRARAQKWKNEKVKFVVCHDVDGKVEKSSTVLARHKCTHKDLQQWVSRLAWKDEDPIFVVDYVQEVRTGEVLYPEDMMTKCAPLPSKYRVVARVARPVEDAGLDEGYEGSLAVLVEQVPALDETSTWPVTAADLREWLMFGIQEEHPEVQFAISKVFECQGDVDKVELDLSKVPFMRLTDKRGRDLPLEVADAEREAIYARLLAEKERAEEVVESAKAAVQQTIDDIDKVDVLLTNAEDDPDFYVGGEPRDSSQVRTWYVSFRAPNRRFLEELITNKADWHTVKLGLGHEPVDATGYPQIGAEAVPPWAGRGAVPDGSKPYFPDYSAYKTNMCAVTVRRVQHGFGVFKSLPNPTLPFHGDRFEYYHGRFHSGRKHGAGVDYSDDGVYAGQYVHGHRRGVGRMDYANGDTYDGTLGNVTTEIPPSVLPGANPYANGVPHGQGTRTYADGSRFVGTFVDGLPSGPGGRYDSAMGEVLEGTFLDGELHGPGKISKVGR